MLKGHHLFRILKIELHFNRVICLNIGFQNLILKNLTTEKQQTEGVLSYKRLVRANKMDKIVLAKNRALVLTVFPNTEIKKMNIKEKPDNPVASAKLLQDINKTKFCRKQLSYQTVFSINPTVFKILIVFVLMKCFLGGRYREDRMMLKNNPKDQLPKKNKKLK